MQSFGLVDIPNVFVEVRVDGLKDLPGCLDAHPFKLVFQVQSIVLLLDSTCDTGAENIAIAGSGWVDGLLDKFLHASGKFERLSQCTSSL